MSHPRLENVNIKSVILLATPRELQNAVPHTSASLATVLKGRETLEHILDDEDHRLLAIVGPCSIHNLEAAEEYASRLKKLSDEISDTICVIMPNKNWVNLGFPRGVNLSDPNHLLSGTGKRARHVKIASLEAVNPSALLDLVHASVAQIKAT